MKPSVHQRVFFVYNKYKGIILVTHFETNTEFQHDFKTTERSIPIVNYTHSNHLTKYERRHRFFDHGLSITYNTVLNNVLGLIIHFKNDTIVLSL